MRRLAGKLDRVLQSHSVSGWNQLFAQQLSPWLTFTFNRMQGYYLDLDIRLRHCRVCFYGDRFFRTGPSPEVTIYLSGDCQQVYALVWLHSHLHRLRNPGVVQQKLGFPHFFFPLAAAASAEELRSRGQTLTPCQFGMRSPV